jgi:hypothetical protein
MCVLHSRGTLPFSASVDHKMLKWQFEHEVVLVVLVLSFQRKQCPLVLSQIVVVVVSAWRANDYFVSSNNEEILISLHFFSWKETEAPLETLSPFLSFVAAI